MSGLDVQLLHFTCCFAVRCFTSVATTETQEEFGRWAPEARAQPAVAGKLMKDALAEVRTGFARKVFGLLAAQLLATAAAALLLSSLLQELQRRLAKWAIFLTFCVILAPCVCPRRVTCYPMDLISIFVLAATQASLIAPAMGGCSPAGLLVSAIATAGIFTVLRRVARSDRADVTQWEPQLFAGMLALYPWGFLLVLMAIFQVPVSPWAQVTYDVVSASAVVLCALADLRRIVGGTCAGRGFGVDSAGLASSALHHGVTHIFLKLVCLSLSVTHAGLGAEASSSEL